MLFTSGTGCFLKLFFGDYSWGYEICVKFFFSLIYLIENGLFSNQKTFSEMSHTFC